MASGRDGASCGASSRYFLNAASAAGLEVLVEEPPVLVFDELHKFSRWKQFLKGFFDLYEKQCRVVVTGSSRWDTYRRGGDSLMGR